MLKNKFSQLLGLVERWPLEIFVAVNNPNTNIFIVTNPIFQSILGD